MIIVLDDAERVQSFMIGLTFSIMSYVFRETREGSFFHSIVSTANDVELMVREEIKDSKRPASGEFSSTSSGDIGSHIRGRFFQRLEPVYALLPIVESG